MSVLRLAVFGPPEIFHDNTRLTFPLRKAQALLLYLAVEGGMHSRSKLATLLWPDSTPEAGRIALRNALVPLRDRLDASEGAAAQHTHLSSSRDLPGHVHPTTVVVQHTRTDLQFLTERGENMTRSCTHLDQIQDVTPSGKGCEECLQTGDTWVHLRLCRICGHVGCCDSSKNKHATRHFHSTNHPIIQSFEPGETWGWCYPDQVEVSF